MFGRKAQSAAAAAKAVKTQTAARKPASPQEAMVAKIEKLTAGKPMSFQLPLTYGGDVVVVELNPHYPDKGRKYAVVSVSTAGSKPGSHRRTLWATNKTKVLAHWLIDKDAQLIT